MAPDDVLQDGRRGRVLVQRVGDGGDGSGRDVVTLRDEVGQLADHGRGGLHRLVVPVERDDVAPQEQVAGDVFLQRPQHRVPAARQLGGDLVGKLDLAADR